MRWSKSIHKFSMPWKATNLLQDRQSKLRRDGGALASIRGVLSFRRRPNCIPASRRWRKRRRLSFSFYLRFVQILQKRIYLFLRSFFFVPLISIKYRAISIFTDVALKIHQVMVSFYWSGKKSKLILEAEGRNWVELNLMHVYKPGTRWAWLLSL